MSTDTITALPQQLVLRTVAAGTMLAVPHQRTALDEDHPAVSYPSRWPEQRSESFLVSGSTEHMNTPTTMITASTIAPILRSPKVRTRRFLLLVCARCIALADVTTTRTRHIWTRLWETEALRMRIIP